MLSALENLLLPPRVAGEQWGERKAWMPQQREKEMTDERNGQQQAPPGPEAQFALIVGELERYVADQVLCADSGSSAQMVLLACSSATTFFSLRRING